ncbi:hypothetical protein [Jiella avicenniae]|uniref:Uncharacterized protein n=1 Tax=Jiella avicenniae TaxID=2907202 RepID=A0A9X1P2T3_9HYPH|nr:hypothetical protein [Jiella avicenniae]MCE7029161.1 hypothetical protein [Jiella avicenniae]
MSACCTEASAGGDVTGFRPIGGDRRRYRPGKPVMELLQLAAAVLVCAALIGGFIG